ncbi:epoxide hydrolase N-terminal domain-containing protein [Frankia sp. R82]|uniref:epoxide hydrolase N-terminal domain-containing protein n=1 Tax=Frankia sp. R82 TaxID=2950553 RepID=UPI002042F4BA|nr:epoxide hydrolase N-terminal domain-containing protein [Frankia sp. R82]MCM3882294.1 epoxide hydrolase N-terminal domain-containing protein [Frankia sp. R82]
MSDVIVAVHPEYAAEPIADLRERLRRSRWADREVVDDRTQGIPLAHLRELREYWTDGHAWTGRDAHWEKALSRGQILAIFEQPALVVDEVRGFHCSVRSAGARQNQASRRPSRQE